jgi:hypothetical protein
VRALERDIPRLSDRQVALRMSAIVALVHDGHTQLPLARPVFARERSYPVRIERFADGIHVVAVRPDDREILGARVVEIGERPAAAVWDSVTSIVPGDNVFLKMSPVPVRLTSPEVMSALGLADSSALALDLELATGTRVTRSIAAVTAPDDVGWYFGSRDGPAGATLSLPDASAAVDLPFRHRAAPYWFVLEGRTLYAQINQILSSRDTVTLDGTRAVVSLPGFGERIGALVDSGKVDRLVIDLRYNGGGNNDLARPVVAAIASRPAINQRGKLFVITGRMTYSAAMNFTSMLEERTEAIFVGEPPGGSPSHYGDNTGFQLPNSKLPLRVSTLHWTLGVSPTDVREVMRPDIPAPPRFAEYREGRDGALDAIRRYAPNDVLSDRLLAVYVDSGIDAAIREYRSLGPAGTPTSVWDGDDQQLLAFASGTIAKGNRADIFRAYDFVTEVHPESFQAWFARGRVYAFVNDVAEVKRSFARARALRPQHELIRRFDEAAKRR